jgi:predicted PurR-regulated permease PerM
MERVAAWLTNMEARVERLDLPVLRGTDLSAQLREALDPERVAALVEERQGELMRRAWSTALGVGRGFGALLGIVGYLVLVPVLLFYLLRDWDVLVAHAAGLIPEPARPTWAAFFREYDKLLSRFLRGQLLAAAIVGVLTWIGLLIVGFPQAGLVGAIAGVFNIVPYLGLIASVIPVVLIALVSGGTGGLLIKAGIVFAIVQFIDGSVTGPRIVGESVGLHPVWVIFALAVAGFAFGFAGLLIAMPLAVLIKLLLREGLARWRQSDMFLGEGGGSTATATASGTADGND